MRPDTWIEKMLWWLWWPWRKTQCKAELPFRHGNGCAYCVRRIDHPGQHETNDGESFP